MKGCSRLAGGEKKYAVALSVGHQSTGMFVPAEGPLHLEPPINPVIRRVTLGIRISRGGRRDAVHHPARRIALFLY